MTNSNSRAIDSLAVELSQAGVTDTHFHIGPELLPRRYDVAGLAAAARAWEATLVLKNHTYPTTPLAAHARQHEGVNFLGGTVLNRFVGGLSADAVMSAWSGNRADVSGARNDPTFVVWMPTVHAESHLASQGQSFDPRWGGCEACNQMHEEAPGDEVPVRVFDPDGQPVPELALVLEAIAQYGARLATGHLSAEEIMKLVPLALAAGVPSILLTHPHYPSVELSDEQLIELTKNKNVYIEHCLAIHTIEQVPLTRFEKSIEATGTEQVILSTDFGQVQSDPFPDATIRFAHSIDRVSQGRIPHQELISMFTKNPKRALGLVAE